MGGMWDRFTDFAAANKDNKEIGFLVKAYDYNSDFVSVYAKSNGRIISRSYDIPAAPPPVELKSNDFESIKLKIVKPTHKRVLKLLVKTEEYLGKDIKGTEKLITFDISHTSEVYTIRDLKPNRKFTFSVAYVTDVIGRTHFSKDTIPILTKLCSPPVGLEEKLSEKTKSSIVMNWNKPMKIGNMVQINLYKITISNG